MMAHHHVLESDWGDAQPSADDENVFLESHTWDEYAEWHLGLTDDRAAEFSHKEIELAAHSLLQFLDKSRG